MASNLPGPWLGLSPQLRPSWWIYLLGGPSWSTLLTLQGHSESGVLGLVCTPGSPAVSPAVLK